MSSASTGRVAGAPTLAERASAAVHPIAVTAIAGGFAYVAVEAYRQIERLIWRPHELLRMLDAAGSLAADFPGRFVPIVLGSILLMLAAEYRPRAVLEGSTAIWIGLGSVGTGAYLLSTFDVGTRWALGILLGAGAAATAAALARTLRGARKPAAAAAPSGRRRATLPVAVGLAAGLLAVRGSIEALTEWDAVIYHVSFARDWMHTLPGLPRAAGPSVGAELSYNYPALFPSIGIAIAAPLHLSVVAVAKLISPLAAVSILAVLRVASGRSGLAGWAASMFLLGSTFFVAYGQWPTAYMLMMLLMLLGVARLLADRRLKPATAALIGLVGGTALIGVVFVAIIVATYVALRMYRRAPRPLAAAARLQLRAIVSAAPLVGLLVAPIAVVAVASLRNTRSLFFPWVTWPHGGHLLPTTYWDATHREIVANGYGQYGAEIGDFAKVARGIATSHLFAPRGLLLAGSIVVIGAAAAAGFRRALLAGAALVVGASMLLIALQLVWPRYFLPVSIASAVGLGVVVRAVAAKRAASRLNGPVAYGAATIAAWASLASGGVYALAGPNDRGYTATTNYAQQRASAFEAAREAANAREKTAVVFGDDVRAWRDVEMMDARGVNVGTFDVRNYFSPYRSRLQLDGRVGASITGGTAPLVVRQLKRRGIDAVFIPSWFWEPGAGRHPLADRSAVALWVGSPSLRAIRVYLPYEDVSYPSVLYAVGPAARRRAEQLIGSPRFSMAGPLASRRSVHGDGFAFEGIVGRALHWRLAAPVTEAGGPTLRFATRDLKAAADVTINEPRVPTLFQPATFVDCSHVPRWAKRSTVDVVFPGSPLGFAVLDVAGRPNRETRFRGEVQRIDKDVLVHACGDPTTARGGVFPAGSGSTRISVVLRDLGPLALSFDYLDDSRGEISFNAYDPLYDRWLYNVAALDRCGSGRWLHAQLPLRELSVPLFAGIDVDLGVVVAENNFTVRNLRLVEAHRRNLRRC